MKLICIAFTFMLAACVTDPEDVTAPPDDGSDDSGDPVVNIQPVHPSDPNDRDINPPGDPTCHQRRRNVGCQP